mmetsp:Transcript_32679/g.97071  ORF Transcript_32679/g.97071 Transcript_32679/m.97071 type:complete len:582 (-) Transcript_32679:72-1817(-)
MELRADLGPAPGQDVVAAASAAAPPVGVVLRRLWRLRRLRRLRRPRLAVGLPLRAPSLERSLPVSQRLLDCRRQQLRRRLLLVDHLDLRGDPEVIILHEGDREALLPRAPGPPDLVDVLDGVFRRVVVDHEFDFVEVESSSQERRADQDGEAVVLSSEPLQDLVPLLLRHRAAEALAGEVLGLEEFNDLPHRLLLATEDQSFFALLEVLGHLGVSNGLHELLLLARARILQGLARAYPPEVLDDVLAGTELGPADVDVDRLDAAEIIGELFDLLRPRRGVQQDLPVWPHVGDDLADGDPVVRLQHAVRLVQDDEGRASEVRRLSVQEVGQPAWRCHDGVAPLQQLALLPVVVLAAHDSSANEPAPAAHGVDLHLHLLAELARGHEDEADRSLPWPELVLGEDVDDHRQNVRERLAAAGLRDPHDVKTLQRGGPGQDLDGGGLLEAPGAQLLRHPVRERRHVEGRDRLRKVLTPLHHVDGVLEENFFHLWFGHRVHLGVLHVEVLADGDDLEALPVDGVGPSGPSAPIQPSTAVGCPARLVGCVGCRDLDLLRIRAGGRRRCAVARPWALASAYREAARHAS